MKKTLHLFAVLAIFSGCSSDDDVKIEESVDINNILNLSVSISTPERDRDFTYHKLGDSGIFEDPHSHITFAGKIDLQYKSDSNRVPPSKIHVKWFSNVDGVLFSGNADDQNQSSFEQILSENTHTIYFEASVGNNAEFTAIDSINLCNIVSLQVVPTDRSVKLNWSKYKGGDFQSYLIYGEDFEPVTEIFDINTLEYEANITLAETTKFQVVVKTLEGENATLGSNIETAEAGKYTRIPHFITKAVNDSLRNKIYAIVGEEFYSHDYASEYGLIILDNVSEKVAVNTHILKEYRFSDLDLSPDGRYLFLCERYVDKITRVDLNTLEVKRFDIATYEWGIHKIEVGNDYKLYCHRTPPTSGDSPLFILNGETGAQLGPYGGFVHGDIEFNVKNNKLYHSTSVREKWVIKFSVDNDHVVREKIFSPYIWWPKPTLLLSEDGEHIFWEQFQLDKELNIVREFEDHITACSPKSNYLSDGIRLMQFNSLETVFEYPKFPYHSLNKEIFTSDNSLVFITSGQPYTNERYTYFFKMNIR